MSLRIEFFSHENIRPMLFLFSSERAQFHRILSRLVLIDNVVVLISNTFQQELKSFVIVNEQNRSMERKLRWLNNVCRTCTNPHTLERNMFFSTSFASEYGYTVAVDAGNTECFFQSIIDENAANVEIDYQNIFFKLFYVLDGGDMDIVFTLLDPNNNILFEDDRRTDNSHKFDVTHLKGDYQICFDNSFSYTTSKYVFFQMFVYDTNGNLEEIDYKKTAHQGLAANAAELGMKIEDFTAISGRIKSNLNRAEQTQMILRTYEFRDQMVMNANLERVSFWSGFNLFVMVCVSIFQVYMIRSLFMDKSKMGKMFKART